MITDVKINKKRKAYYYEKGYWSDQTLNDIWSRQALLYPTQEYVCDDQGTRFTYEEVNDKAARLASWFIEEGVVPGDVITFQLPTWAEFALVYVACLKVGAVMHPLSRTFNDEDLVYHMNKVGSKVFICPTFFHKCNYEKQILSIYPRVPSLTSIALIEKGVLSHSVLPTFSELFSHYAPLALPPQSDSDQVACILSTSGTTGKPKAVLFTHNNLLFSERSFIAGFERTRDDVMFMPSPLNHATGFFHGLIAPLLLGGRTVLQQDFNAKDAVDLINSEGATWSMGATPFIYDILNYAESPEGISPSSLKLFLCGGAPVPGSLVTQAWKHKILLCEVYGSTESCPHVYVPPKKCLQWNGAWSGIPFEGIEVRVVDRNRQELPCGLQGEECSRGPHQFVGYLNDPERTSRALDEEGWFYSGDLCVMDDKNRIRINGRKKEIIIRGGENICTREIDDHLAGCPGIGDHATIGMPDDRLGERICTFIVPVNNRYPTLTDITKYLAKRHVAKRLWPEHVEYIDALPLTVTGKVQRFLLARELEKRMNS